MPQLKSFNVEILSSSTQALPPSAELKLSLLDTSLADAPSINIAELSLRCGSTMPIQLELTFDPSQIIPRHVYSLAVSIRNEGQLLYTNTSHHSIDPTTVFGTQRVTVDKVGTGVDGLHGGNGIA